MLTRPVSLRPLQAEPDCDWEAGQTRPRSQGGQEKGSGSAGVRGEHGLLREGGVKGLSM